jgi:hypothetical protein
MRTRKYCLFKLTRESATITFCFGRKSKAGRGVAMFEVKMLTWGSCGQAN